MRVFIIVLIAGLLSACAGKTVTTQSQIQPAPKPINVPAVTNFQYSPVVDYLQPLISNLTQQPYYNLINPRRLTSGYIFDRQISETDPRKTVFAYRSKLDDSWAYVTSGIGAMPVANVIAFSDENLGRAYALVLKQVKVCFVTQASGVPQWRGGKWFFPVQPGYFECTGLANKSIFKIGYGLPGVIGPYFGERDTVLIFRDLGQLQQVLYALRTQFPALKIPKV